MKKKIIGILAVFIFTSSVCFAAWDAAKPADNGVRKNAPAEIRANWAAIATGTDAALCITDAKTCASAAIADTKLAQITTASKVSGAALTLLGSVPSGGGQLPIANGGTGQATATAALNALLPSQGTNTGKALVTDNTNTSWGYPASLTIASAATGDLLYYNGTAWVRLAAGTSGYYLKGAGASAPTWTDLVNTTTGHDHDGTDSKKVVYTNLDMTGITNGHVLYNNNGTPAGMSLTAVALGSSAAKSENTVYQAATDGFIVGYVTTDSSTNSGDFEVRILSDASNPPTTIMQTMKATDAAAGDTTIPFCSPVKKNNYYKIDDVNAHYTTVANWIPLS